MDDVCRLRSGYSTDAALLTHPTSGEMFSPLSIDRNRG